ncbi:MAG: hypothetical protein K0U93_27030, partial [Gammaproteobacteria bacterium]|nr:hypothetical protein [Gammaproteobacteria bacterium]
MTSLSGIARGPSPSTTSSSTHRDPPVCSLLCWVVLCFGIILSAPTHAFSLAGAKNKLVDFLLEKVSVPGEFEVKAESVSDGTDGGTVLNGITIVDAKGVWFRAESFELAWSPTRLVRGDVQIDRLHLTKGRLLRLPSAAPSAAEADDEPSTEGGGWPRSPITVLIADLQIRDMQISEGVLAQPLSFDASGKLADEGDEQSLQLNISRTDATAGSIVLEYLKRFDTGNLRLSLSANEAAGGLVAAYAGLDDSTPASLSVNADGPPDNWAGTLSLAADQTLQVSGDIKAAWAEKISGDFRLDLKTGAKLSEPLRLALGERAGLTISLAEDDSGIVRIDQAQLSGAAVQA